MLPVLLIDFGSTNTKVTAVDADAATLLGTGTAFTTVETDVGEGLAAAIRELEQTTGPLTYAKRFACSSAAGGLRMAASGLVPNLTAAAARVASLGAGAKVVKLYSYELTDEDVAEIDQIRPDIFLLTGGVDGGNADCIRHNAGMLATCETRFPILLAGNRSAASACEKLLAGREVYRCPNVMPTLDQLNVEPVQAQIRELFLRRIIQAKGLTRAAELLDRITMPTPAALLTAMKLLAGGTQDAPGLGELMAVDLGGATTDVYSMAKGMPEQDSTILKGLPEPFAKRTVEGDIGMRYSAHGVLEEVGAQGLSQLSGLPPDRVEELVAFLGSHPDALPDTPELAALDYALASGAVAAAAQRHAGTIEQVYTPTGPAMVQTGKDLTRVRALVVTGGAVIHAPRAAEIAAHALYSPARPNSLRPKSAGIYLDRSYILAAMGLLAEEYPQAALAIMKQHLEHDGTVVASGASAADANPQAF